jgi:hypothetical protein
MQRTHVPTVLAVAVVAWCLSNLVHEGIGHGGACLLAGGRPLALNAIYFQRDEAVPMTDAGIRFEQAGGSLANLAAAAVSAVFLRRVRPGPTHYFLALMVALGVLMPFGYLLFSGVGGVGDWAEVVEGLGPPTAMRAALAVTGGLLYFGLAPRLLMPALDPYLGRDRALRRRRAWVYARGPYLLGGTVFVVAGLLNPLDPELVLISAAAAAFGGASLLLWFPGGPDGRWAARSPQVPADVERSVPWMVAGVAVAAGFVGVLGPGIRLG